jgi:hypothetical protein
VVEKIFDAKQKSMKKLPPLVVASPILANFSLNVKEHLKASIHNALSEFLVKILKNPCKSAK